MDAVGEAIQALEDAAAPAADTPVMEALAKLLGVVLDDRVNSVTENDDHVRRVNAACMGVLLMKLRRVPDAEWHRWCEVPKAQFLRRLEETIRG
jgi:hypothetical protein